LVPARSAICDATAVAVHIVPAGRLAFGVSVKLVAPPGGAGLRVKAEGVPLGHSRVNADAVTFTALLKLNATALVTCTAVALLVGVVEDTVGAVSTVKLIATFAAICVFAASLICVATAVAIQVLPAGRFALGVKVKDVEVPGSDGLAANAIGVPLGHCKVKAEAVAVTALSKVNTIVVFAKTLVALLTGVVLTTTGWLSTVIATLEFADSGVP
jgi:hypothetical protein